MDDPSSNEALPDSRKRKEGLASRAMKAHYEPEILSSSQNTATLFWWNTKPDALFLYCFVTVPASSVLLYAPAHKLQLRSCLYVSFLKKLVFQTYEQNLSPLGPLCFALSSLLWSLLPSYCLPGQPAFVRKVCVAHICLRPCPYSSSKKYYKELKWVS